VGRIYRLGQTQPVDVINLVTEYGIEARIAGLIGNKKALFSGLFDGTTDAVRFAVPAGFLKDIERLVEPVVVPAAIRDADGSEDSPIDGDATLAPSLDQPELAEASERADREKLPADSSDEPTETRAPPAPAGPTDLPVSVLDANDTTVSPASVAALFERIAVTRTETGALRIEAPPDAAEELSKLLQGLAGLLSATAKR
jgi:hypothetical protein